MTCRAGKGRRKAGLIRLSIGLEDADELIEDLRSALEASKGGHSCPLNTGRAAGKRILTGKTLCNDGERSATQDIPRFDPILNLMPTKEKPKRSFCALSARRPCSRDHAAAHRTYESATRRQLPEPVLRTLRIDGRILRRRDHYRCAGGKLDFQVCCIGEELKAYGLGRTRHAFSTLYISGRSGRLYHHYGIPIKLLCPKSCSRVRHGAE